MKEILRTRNECEVQIRDVSGRDSQHQRLLMRLLRQPRLGGKQIEASTVLLAQIQVRPGGLSCV